MRARAPDMRRRGGWGEQAVRLRGVAWREAWITVMALHWPRVRSTMAALYWPLTLLLRPMRLHCHPPSSPTRSGGVFWESRATRVCLWGMEF